MNIVKKLIVKSYTKDYYIAKYDEIETRRMKSSLQNEFTSFVRFALSSMWLHFYTSIIDFFINTVIVILLVIFKLFAMLVIFAIFMLINNFQAYA